MNIYPWQSGLRDKLLSGALPHALLLKGRRGIGKLDFADYLARSLLCESPLDGGKACGVCVSCTWYAGANHPDFRRIEPESDLTESGRKITQITIDQIRALSGFMSLSTHRNGYRIVLIHPAEAMNPHAANALLKTLEEPFGKTLFLLVTHKPHQLLPTILSRCQAIAMPSPNPPEAENWLREQGIGAPIPFLAEAGQAPLVALELAREDTSLRDKFLKEVSAPSSLDPIALAEAFQKSDLSMILRWLQKWCHDLASYTFSRKIRYYPDLSARIREVSEKTDQLELMRFQRTLLNAQRVSSHPVNVRLFLEDLVLDYRSLTGSYKK